MKERKTKMYLEQGRNSGKEYRVAKLVNRLLPKVDTWLKEEEVKKLLSDDPNLTIEVVRQK